MARVGHCSAWLLTQGPSQDWIDDLQNVKPVIVNAACVDVLWRRDILLSEIKLGKSDKSAEYLIHIVDGPSLTCDQRRDVTGKKTAHCVSWEPKRKPTEVEHRSLDKRKSLIYEVNPGTTVSPVEHSGNPLDHSTTRRRVWIIVQMSRKSQTRLGSNAEHCKEEIEMPKRMTQTENAISQGDR